MPGSCDGGTAAQMTNASSESVQSRNYCRKCVLSVHGDQVEIYAIYVSGGGVRTSFATFERRATRHDSCGRGTVAGWVDSDAAAVLWRRIGRPVHPASAAGGRYGGVVKSRRETSSGRIPHEYRRSLGGSCTPHPWLTSSRALYDVQTTFIPSQGTQNASAFASRPCIMRPSEPPQCRKMCM